MRKAILLINIMVLLLKTSVFSQDTVSVSVDTIPTKKEKHFKKLEETQQKYLHWIDKKNREFPFALPAVAYNKYDGVQIGAILINLKQPVKHVDFTGSLLYGIKSKKVNGTANVDYYIRLKKGVVSQIKPGVRFQSFTYADFVKPLKYYAIHPEIVINFNHRTEKLEKISHQVIFRSHVVLQKDITFNYGTSTFDKDTLTRFYVNEFQYHFKREDKNFPVNASLNFEQSKQFLKTYVVVNSFIRYQLKNYNTGVHLRFFVGGFLWRKNQFFFNNLTYADYGFSANGRTGSQDYFYNDFYFNRNGQDGFGANQITKTDGFLKTVAPKTVIGQTPNWMLAFNLKLDFPIKFVPIKFFFDLAYSYNNKYGNGAPLPIKSLQYDAGMMFSFFDEGFEIYLPFLVSKDYKTYNKANAPKFGQRITFLLDLHKIELYKKIRDLRF
ncbi:MAG TPA: hypothetical protein PK431_01150 [Chitinophagales bacterium]|nr:hypothetical protein [Chitinophagales bacterium]